MTTIKLDVLFKKIQKDDKKENLEMHIIKEEIPFVNELMNMAGGMVVLQITECQEIPAHFKAMQRDSKKVTLKFEVKGNHTERILEMYKWAGGSTALHLAESQLSIDDVYEETREGMGFTLDTGGVVTLAEGQLSIDEIEQDEQEQTEAEEAGAWLNSPDPRDATEGSDEKEEEEELIDVFQVEPEPTAEAEKPAFDDVLL